MTNSKKIETSALTEEQQAAFIEGWENAGGYADDLDECSPYPWCCPWLWSAEIFVDGDTPEEWGASWWDQCKNEIDELSEVSE